MMPAAPKTSGTRGRIAAVVVCHNLGRTLEEALASVERQTRAAAEIVVVDDRSTDVYTRQVLGRLEREGTRVIHSGGHGASGARNAGADGTVSDYLVWLDADDILEPGYFEAAATRVRGRALCMETGCADVRRCDRDRRCAACLHDGSPRSVADDRRF
jgi:glycosyltransferase involved in cell wall biosynthesis